MVCVVFLFAYGVSVQSLLYPHSGEALKNILYNIFYHPYLSMFQDFDSHLDELLGMRRSVFSVYLWMYLEIFFTKNAWYT